MELFKQKGISYIASVLGNPFYMDSITANQQRLAYAKVCVEVEASMEIPSSIEVELRDGASISVRVEVPWIPAKCSRCGIFGHGEKVSPRKPVEPAKRWIPKAKEEIIVIEGINIREDKKKQYSKGSNR